MRHRLTLYGLKTYILHQHFTISLLAGIPDNFHLAVLGLLKQQAVLPGKSQLLRHEAQKHRDPVSRGVISYSRRPFVQLDSHSLYQHSEVWRFKDYHLCDSFHGNYCSRLTPIPNMSTTQIRNLSCVVLFLFSIKVL